MKIAVFHFYSFSWLPAELSAHTNHTRLDLPLIFNGENHVCLFQQAELVWRERTLSSDVLSGVTHP